MSYVDAALDLTQASASFARNRATANATDRVSRANDGSWIFLGRLCPHDATRAAGSPRDLPTVVSLESEHDFEVNRIGGRVLRGWARALLGAPEKEGLAEMHEAVATYRSLPGIMARPFLLSVVDSERRTRHFDRADATLAEAEAVIRQHGEHLYGALPTSSYRAYRRRSSDTSTVPQR